MPLSDLLNDDAVIRNMNDYGHKYGLTNDRIASFELGLRSSLQNIGSYLNPNIDQSLTPEQQARINKYPWSNVVGKATALTGIGSLLATAPVGLGIGLISDSAIGTMALTPSKTFTYDQLRNEGINNVLKHISAVRYESN